MKGAKLLFHYISYLQYPLMLVGLFYVYLPFFTNFNSLLSEYNKALVFVGLAISFSTLQDSQKTQNKLSKRIWENPKHSKIFLSYLTILILFILAFGFFCLFTKTYVKLYELSFGIISVGIGLIGLLKSALEMADFHQSKTPATSMNSSVDPH